MALIYGHRGARGEAPENTLAGFQHCLALGVTCCELDLHLSYDGELMVIHDPTLERTTGRQGYVAEQYAAQLVTYDARKTGPEWPTICPIPRLAELFEKCPFNHWQLEVKSTSSIHAEKTIQAIQTLVAQYNMMDKTIITSSSKSVLHAAQVLAPDTPRGLVAEFAIEDPINLAQRYNCDFLVLNYKLCTKKRLIDAQQQGLHVSVWTVNDPTEIKRLVDLGVDSIITDYPGLAKKITG